VYILYYDESSERTARAVFSGASWAQFVLVQPSPFFENAVYVKMLKVCNPDIP
jgi:hypothetical protein